MNFRGLRTGTLILTERGEVAVESTRIGERVMALAAGRLVPIRWIGCRPLDFTTAAPIAGHSTIRVARGAFDDDKPLRDLALESGHLVLIDGALIAIDKLLNGATIVQEMSDQQAWWQIDLVRHDVLLAEGLPVESFRENPNDLCVAQVAAGPVLTAVKTRLLARAKDVFGFSITDDRRLHITADGEVCLATHTDADLSSFAVPPTSRDLYLMSRTWVPQQMDPLSTDSRRLGVCVRRMILDGGREVRLDDPALSAGWHPPERDGVGPFRWTDGAATLPAGARTIAVELCGERLYWTHLDPPPYPGNIVPP
jgi:Hint domain